MALADNLFEKEAALLLLLLLLYQSRLLIELIVTQCVS
jgi:hypothetical protein